MEKAFMVVFPNTKYLVSLSLREVFLYNMLQWLQTWNL